jgi:drug/metabolite transporter (DMT)-like permease
MKKGVMFALITALISGISIFINAFGVKGINPYLFTFLKNIIVAVFLISLIVLFKNFKELKRLDFKDWRILVLIGLIGGSIPFLLFFKGLQLTTAGESSFIHKTMFVFVSIMAVMFLREKLTKKVIIPALILLVGNFLLLSINNFSLSYGNLLILIATLFWSVEIIIAKKVLKRLNSDIVAFGRMFFGSIFILIFLIFTNQLSLINTVNYNNIGWILITSLFLFAYVFTWYKALKFTEASLATAILLVGGIVTTLFDLVFLHKVINFYQITGLSLLIIGLIYFVKYIKSTKKEFLLHNPDEL